MSAQPTRLGAHGTQRGAGSDLEAAPAPITMSTDALREHSRKRGASPTGARTMASSYPQSIVWTWINGCTQCSGGLVGHMGITTSTGEIWEFVGIGANQSAPERLAFGPIIRYVPISSRLVFRGTWDSAIMATIERYKSLGCHPGNNCHCFVAACLQEMRFLGLPCWGCLWWLLAVMVWVFGRFTVEAPSLCCAISTLLVTGFIIFALAGGLSFLWE